MKIDYWYTAGNVLYVKENYVKSSSKMKYVEIDLH